MAIFKQVKKCVIAFDYLTSDILTTVRSKDFALQCRKKGNHFILLGKTLNPLTKGASGLCVASAGLKLINWSSQ